MFASWRIPLIAALALAAVPAAGAAEPLDQAALEELESLLRDLGFDPGPVDGVVDDETTAAIRRYQEFALLPGEPEPDRRLLEELRGVAAAFAALNAVEAEAPAAPVPAPQVPPQEESAALPEAPLAPEALPDPAPEVLPEKSTVPPPLPPPKLTAPVTPEGKAAEVEEEPAELAKLLPPDAEAPFSAANLPPDVILDPDLLNDPGVYAPGEEPADPSDDMQARIIAALAPFQLQLQYGSLTRKELARQFNAEGRKLLQQAQYDAAILKFSVAIHLDPSFAGAYSNRGTAYQRQDESELAKADFDKARELGFGGFRVKDASNPLN